MGKIAPSVVEQTADGDRAEFLIVLSAQADLSGADALPMKEEKGRFVRDALWKVAQETQSGVLALLRARGVEHRAYYIVNMIWARGSLEDALALAGRAEVARVEGNPRVHNLPEPFAAAERAEAQGVAAIEPGIGYSRAPEVWATGFTGQGIVVGGADSGYRWTHEVLKPRYRGWNGVTADHNYNWHDSIHSGGGVCGANSPVPCDDHGHGSHTIGTAVGADATNVNQIGMAPGAKWIGCRNMDQGAGTPATYMECLEFFLAPYPVGGSPAQGDPARAPHISTNSWSCPPSEGCGPDTLRQAFEAQRAAGILSVVSANNSGPNCSTVNTPPAIYASTYSVGALVLGTDTAAGFSSRGPVTVEGSYRTKPNLSAPGTNIRSAWGGSDADYATIQGTSMATPHVAGAAALLLSARPALIGNVAAIRKILNESAVPIASNTCDGGGGPAVSPNNTYGYGRLDAKGAVDHALTACTPPVVNLMSWWAGENNVRDLIGSQNGTLQNGATFGPGRVGQAFQLDGVDDYVSTGNLPELQDATGLTVLAWVNKTDDTNTFGGFVGKWDTAGSANNSFLLYTGEAGSQGRGGFVVQFDNNAAAGLIGATIIPSNQWVLVAGTWRSSDGQIILYKNGAADGVTTGGTGRTLKYHTAFPARVGEWGVLHANPAYKFKGRIDEPMIFNRALTQAEIQAIYDAGTDGVCQDGLTTVTTLDGNGVGSLPAALSYANARPGADTISFAPEVTGEIVLNTSLQIIDDVLIAGPGARSLAIVGRQDHRVFEVIGGVSVQMNDLTIRDGNPLQGSGGGIHNSGTLTLRRSRVLDNIPYGLFGTNFPYLAGGGIYNAESGILLIDKCEISGNTLRSAQLMEGAGIHNRGTLTMIDSTLADNFMIAGDGSITRRGAGIYTHRINNSPGTVALRNCTITGNRIEPYTADETGGGVQGEGVAPLVTVANTIIGGNTALFAADVGGAFISQGHNLISITNNSTGWNTNPADPHRDRTGTSSSPQPPGFAGGKANNGGPTNTVALGSGSVALNAGNDANATGTDQRGYPRVGVSDIGAFEFGSVNLLVIRTARLGDDIIVDFFEAVQGQTYRLEREVALTNPNWLPIAGLPDYTAPANGSGRFIHSGGAAGARGFYRVRRLP